jgi:Na+-transporting methylmalonyl-CoA/oxaloacetate decarboxylase gamma subunit
MLEVIKLQWHLWVSWVTPEKIYSAGIGLAVVLSFLCLIVIAVMLLFGAAIGQARDGGIAIKKCDNEKT